MEKRVYIRLRQRVQVRPNEEIYIKDVAQIIAEDPLYERIGGIFVYKVQESDQNMVIIDVMKVIKAITKQIDLIDIQTIGPTQVIVEVIFKKRMVSWPAFLLIWFLLFFGAALTIMNFHEDVSMQGVHQRIYFIITGKWVEKPLLFQIPYSFGLGIGMIIFFNHVFKKRLNEEPSPLEVEMFNYQQDLDRYVVMHENKEEMSRIDDH
ncbi:stage V sporulation protein AA [Bacillaceae bacterium Marseille-Q3522]|nr:stage V sporulation protein AA [Bacillaceae bacterium Marseille-Q3522]